MEKEATPKTIRYWQEGAQRALETMTALFEKEKYPESLFFGHLALEKILKALVVQITQEHAPYTHDLQLLANKIRLKLLKNQ